MCTLNSKWLAAETTYLTMSVRLWVCKLPSKTKQPSITLDYVLDQVLPFAMDASCKNILDMDCALKIGKKLQNSRRQPSFMTHSATRDWSSWVVPYNLFIYLKSLPTLDFSASTPTTHLSFKAWLKTQGTCTGWDLVHKWRNEIALFGQCGPTQSHLVLKFVCPLSLEKSCSFSRVLPVSCPENHNNNNNRSSAKWCAWQQHPRFFFPKASGTQVHSKQSEEWQGREWLL